MNQLKLLTAEQVLLETELFEFLGLTDDHVNELVQLQHDPETVAGLTSYIEHYNAWDSIDGLTFCLVPFDDIKRVLLKGGAFKDDPSFDTVEGSVHILVDGSPVMFLCKERFSPAVLRHELVHFRQVKEGMDKRIGLSRYWLGEKKPDYFSATRTQEEQYALPWELEAYAVMYDDASMKREHDVVLSYIEAGINHDIVEAMRTFYRMIIIPSGRVLPFDIKILDDEPT